MTRKDLNDTWAWSQVEAAADGSLGPEQSMRMESAMRSDPRLRRAVERSQQVRLALGNMKSPAMPGGLLGRLLGISSRGRRARPLLSFGAWTLVPATVCAALVVAVLVSGDPETAALSPEEQAAVQDFYTAMTYVRRSAVIAGDEIADQVGYGIREAIDTSRGSMPTVDKDRENGDQ